MNAVIIQQRRRSCAETVLEHDLVESNPQLRAEKRMFRRPANFVSLAALEPVAFPLEGICRQCHFFSAEVAVKTNPVDIDALYVHLSEAVEQLTPIGGTLAQRWKSKGDIVRAVIDRCRAVIDRPYSGNHSQQDGIRSDLQENLEPLVPQPANSRKELHRF